MIITHPKVASVTQWARREAAIRALVVTGSLARADGGIDEFSDLDVQVITPDIKRYASKDNWLSELGEVWICYPPRGDLPYRLVWFKGGVKVDFQFLRPADLRVDELADEYLRGYHVLVDKDDFFRDLPPSPRVFPAPPSPQLQEIQDSINEFFFEAIHVAQYIRRREFWVVKHRDWTMKRNLLRLLEWHAHLTRPQPINTWLLGRRISFWTDDESKAAIECIWSGWEANSLWDAFFLQIGLFQRLAKALTRRLGFQYDDKTFQEITAYLQRLRREDRESGATE